MRTLAPRERKLIALLILSVLLSVLYLLIIAPFVSGFSDRAMQRANLMQQYQGNQRVIGSIPRLRRQAERQRGSLASFALTAATPQIAAAALQTRVQQALEAAGAQVSTVEDVATDDATVRVRVSARSTLAQLTRILERLHNEPPYLTIESLAVTADQAVISGRLEPMEISIEVSLPVLAAKPR